jgi:hypothetical protein
MRDNVLAALSFSCILVPLECSQHLTECSTFAGQMLDPDTERSIVTRKG